MSRGIWYVLMGLNLAGLALNSWFLIYGNKSLSILTVAALVAGLVAVGYLWRERRYFA